MIEINLLPEEIKKKKKRSSPRIDASAISMPSIPAAGIAAAIVVVVLAIQLILFVLGAMSAATIKTLDNEYKSVLPKRVETERLKFQVDVMNKKVAAIDELMVKRFSWEKKLNSLSDSMIPGIWLTDLSYDEKITDAPPKPINVDPTKKKSQGDKQAAEKILSRYLIISGAASSMSEEGTALIGRFIKSLKDNPLFYSDFSDIELGTIKREKMEDQEIMTFKITCFFKAR